MSKLTRGLSWLERRYDHTADKLKTKLNLRDPAYIQPYIGYGGTRNGQDWCWIKGRVLEDVGIEQLPENAGLWNNLKNQFKRYETDEIRNALVEFRLGSKTHTAKSNEEGFFEFNLNDLPAGTLTTPWTEFDLRLTSIPAGPIKAEVAQGRLLTVAEDCEYAIVSDIDDTIVKTGATTLFKHVRTVLTNSAASREPFPGVAEFYKALTDGPDGQGYNPIFYVSSSPWNLYGLFERFLEVHDIPLGPIRLKDFGLTKSRLFKTSHQAHKIALIESYLNDIPELPFILIGDSGQSDALVYAEVAERFRNRIHAVYMRDVTEKPTAKMQEGRGRIEACGIPFLAVKDSAEAARHAEQNGWLTQSQRQQVEAAVAKA